jgi:hypothetical protein
VPVRSRLACVFVALLVQVGCGAAPSPTPGDILAVRDELVRRGVTIGSVVGGESACPRQPLHDNALHLVVSVSSDARPRDLYLYLFRPREFEETAAQMDACEAEYAEAVGDGPTSRVDVAPYRALGNGWSPDLEQAVTEALGAAGGGP